MGFGRLFGERGDPPQLCKLLVQQPHRAESSLGRGGVGWAAGPWGWQGEKGKRTQWNILHGFAGVREEGWGSLKAGPG